MSEIAAVSKATNEPEKKKRGRPPLDPAVKAARSVKPKVAGRGRGRPPKDRSIEVVKKVKDLGEGKLNSFFK